MARTGSSVIKEKDNVKNERNNFGTYWQILHDYFYVDSSNITTARSAGEELDFFNLYDNTTLDSADILASGMTNYLTPYTSKWISLRPINQQLLRDKEVMAWMQAAEEEVSYILANSNFYTNMPSFFKSSGVYGTSVLMFEDDADSIIRFHNIPVRDIYIVDDHRGKPFKYFIDVEYTAEQAITRFGMDKVSQDLRDTYNRGEVSKKYKFIYYVGPRENRDIRKKDKANMPIEALWIDTVNGNILSEEGYETMPMVAHRFEKRPFISYGYSPAMKALPMARMLNTIAETTLRAAMKATDPPLAMPNNAFIAPLNYNPRAINYYNSGIKPGEDIAPIGNYGNVQVGMAEIEYYTKQVRATMYNDVFVAFDQLTQRMTVPEVMERVNEKMTLLGPAVGRAMSDVLIPIVDKTIATAYKAGRLPKLPDSMMNDPRYEVAFTSKLAQAQKQASLNNLTTAMGIVGQMAELKPEMLDRINGDGAIDDIWAITAAPAGSLNSVDDANKVREQRAITQEEDRKLMAAQEGAAVGETVSRANKNNREQ